MDKETAVAELAKRKKIALKMGGDQKIKKRRDEGHLNARERIDYLFDKNTFVESGLLVKSARDEVKEKTPADGKICGFGKLDNRKAAVISNDFTVLGATSAVNNGKKIKHMREVSTRLGFPLIFLGESAGARMPDRMGAAGRAILGQDALEYQRIRKTPWVSAMLGDCYGSSTWYSCMSDFVVMRKGSTMAVASSRVTAMAINQPIDAQELGGWRMHADTTGFVDVVVETDEEALDAIRKFLSYLPSNCNEAPPDANVPENSGKNMDDLFKIIPDKSNQVYDMKACIKIIIDEDSFFELKPRFGKSIITSLARIDGQSVGIIANNPIFKGGAIDADACRKVTSFLVLCDSFNIPIIFLVDQPGFLIGIDGEKKGAPGKIINWMNALSLCTVPKLSVVFRKSYGQAYLNMGGGRNSDELAAWPLADFGFMASELGVNVLYGVKKEDDPDKYRQLVENLDRDNAPWDLARVYEAKDVIDPRDTRTYLISMLDIYKSDVNSRRKRNLLSNWPTTY